jgi:ADP-dependent NAD(P)H-hydrate dehydratase / NAD(P)H-hydrate epimerase
MVARRGEFVRVLRVRNTCNVIKLYSSQQARAFDARATCELGIASHELMARAGRAAAALALQRWPLAQRMVVLCGPGNNGGDGYIVAHLLRAAVRDVAVFQHGVIHAERNPDAFAARSAYLNGGGVMLTADVLTAALVECELVIDALFGIGARPITGALAVIVENLNALNKTVFALDVPSGLDADTGSAGAVVRADVTLGFIVHKLGLFTGVARRYVGELTLDPLALPVALIDSVQPVARALRHSNFASTKRNPASHKGHFGHVWAVGGAPGFAGAIRLCAQAALRSGAGLVSVLTDPQNAAWVGNAVPELMVHSARQIPEFVPGSVLAIGPGLGKSDWAHLLFIQARSWSGPRVLDADALNILAELDAFALGRSTIITPHPGEAARLLGCDVATIERDRPTAVRAIAEKYGCIALLKGAGTLIAAPNDARLGVCVFGNAGMASGGMGDVLTGVIAALLAQGLGAFEAAEQGALLHAQAADRAAKTGMRGMLASDVIAQLRNAVNDVDAV